MGTPAEKRYYTREVMKLCNVSRKQLLYYEKKQLLSPVGRNTDNNYRYYTQEHITQLFIINEYLSLGFSINEVNNLLRSSFSNLRNYLDVLMIKAQQDFSNSVLRYEHSQRKGRQLMEGLSLLNVGALFQTPEEKRKLCKVVKVPEKYLLQVSGSGSPFDTLSANQKRISALYMAMKKHDIYNAGPLQFTFYGFVEPDASKIHIGSSPMTLAFPVLQVYEKEDFIQKSPSVACASITHVGGYDHSQYETYDVLLQWCRDNHYRLTGSCTEEYIIGSELTRNEDLFVTQIYLPLAE